MKKTAHRLLMGFAFCVALAACGTPPQQAAKAPEKSTFQIRLVADSPAPDASEMPIVQHAPGSVAQEIVEVLLVKNAVLLDHTSLQSAKAAADEAGMFHIDIVFTEAGKKKLAELTRQNIGKRIALVIDNRVYLAPRIMMEITEGRVRISGGSGYAEAQATAAKISAAIPR